MRIASFCIFVAVVFTVFSAPATADEAAAVAALEKLDARIRRDATKPGKPVVGVSLAFDRVQDDDLKLLKELSELATLDLSGNEDLTDAGLKHLKALQRLTKLDLMFVPITDAGVRELKA